jgi:hypothetical protein
MPSALRSALALALVSAAFALGAPGCSEQGQGERCDRDKNLDLDCEAGLECVPGNQLSSEDTTGRCCPEPGTETDKRCTRKTAGSSGGSGGTAGTETGGTAGTETGGTAGTETGGTAGTPAAEAGAAGQAG